MTPRQYHLCMAANLSGFAAMLLRGVLECCGATSEPCSDCRELSRRAAQFAARADLHADALARGL
jgi:hypothetical protein